MQKVVIPEIVISVPFVRAWANAVGNKEAGIIINEIVEGLQHGKIVHYEDIDGWTDVLYEHIQTFVFCKKSAEIPEDKSNLKPDQRYEVEMVNLMAYMMNILRTMDNTDTKKFQLELTPDLVKAMSSRELTLTMEYMSMIACRKSDLFRF